MTQAQRTDWLPLPLHDWHQTQTALHLRAQIVGKTRLALAPMQNHWWQVAQYVTARGLSTSPMPYGDRTLEIEFDFMAHALVFAPLRGRSAPCRSFRSRLRISITIIRRCCARSRSTSTSGRPARDGRGDSVHDDRAHAAYDRDAVERFFKVLLQVDRVLKSFVAVHGQVESVALLVGRFRHGVHPVLGRPATTHPGGIRTWPIS